MNNKTNTTIKEESIMNNNATSNNEATVNTENKEVNAMETNTANNNKEATNMRNSETENKNMEAEAMINENSNNTVANTDTAQITVVTKDVNITTSLIDEEERAIVCENTHKLQDVLRKIDNSPCIGMANIRNVLDNRLYARIYEDTKGFRYVDFCQKYENGGFSSRMRITQDSLLTTAMYTMNRRSMEELPAGIKRKVSSFTNEMTKEYLGKFKGEPRDIIPIDDIFRCLFMALPSLPISSDDERSLRRAEFYKEVVEQAKNCPSQVVSKFKSYYALMEDEIITIAQNMKKSKLSFLRELREYGLLYLTDSSNGYQINVRCKYLDGTDKTEWRYCILKLNHLAGIEDDTTDNDFNLDEI